MQSALRWQRFSPLLHSSMSAGGEQRKPGVRRGPRAPPGTAVPVGLEWLNGILTRALLQSGSIFNLFLLLCNKVRNFSFKSKL